MTILSNIDISKELGKNILIYPFLKTNLKGASYNLTASKLAWDLEKKKSIYSECTGEITIAKNSTALIQTNEVIWVSSKVAGTYHSKVGLVSKGLSHISTTLDPEYIGSSLITVHNYSNEDINLIAEKETFVTLILYFTTTASSVKTGNLPGKTDVLQKFHLTREEKNWLNEEFRNVPSLLKEKLTTCPDYIEIYEYKNKMINSRKIYTISSALFVVIIISLFFLSSNNKKLKQQPWYDLVINVKYTLLLVIPGSVIAKKYSDLK